MTIQVGGWVTGYSAGFFRVEKIAYLKDQQPMAVLKKGFTAKLKPSVSWDTCAVSLCQKVSNETYNEIQSLLNSNNKLAKRFNEFVIPQIKSLYNALVKIHGEKEIKAFEEVLPTIREGKTLSEIQLLLSEYGLEIVNPIDWENTMKLQLVCFDFEGNENGEKIYRDARIY